MRLPSATALPLDPAPQPSRARLEEAARGLEEQFARMLIATMRSTTPGDPILGGNTTYRELHDQQLARTLTRGRGLGLAPMIVRELERGLAPTAPAATGAALPLRPAPAPMSLPAAPTPSGLPLPAGLRADGLLPLTPSHAGVSLGVVTPASPPAPAAPVEAACDPSAPLDCSSPEAFVRSLWPHARKVAAELGVPAKALVAQAALETGWGRRLLGREGAVSSHNLFGIKAGKGWQGPRVDAGTHEYVAGVRVAQRTQFRAYGSVAESFADYARLLGRPRYAAARGTGEDTRGFATALQRAGYATDPAYAAKIVAIAEGATLNRALAALPGAGRG